MPSRTYAGAAVRAITPDLAADPVFLAGFDGNRRATALHDDLYARALSIRVEGDGSPETGRSAPFVLVVCDLIGLLRADVVAIRQAARERGVDDSGMVIASTHVHSGPDTMGLWGASPLRSGVSRRYQAFVRQQIVDAVVEATARMAPAHLRAGRTHLSRWLKNARQPRAVDRELAVLQATSLGHTPIFTLVNLACHPEVMQNENTAITADYAGVVCRAIEDKVGGVGAFASADLGGMMTPDIGTHPRNFATVERMGREIAASALSGLEGGELLELHSARLRRREVHIRLDNPQFRFLLAIGVLPSIRRDRQGWAVTQVSLLELGAARLVTIPGELLPGPGMHLRQVLSVPYRFLIGLADDELGYLIPSDEFVYPRNPFRPGQRYEETMSPGRGALPQLMEAWVALLAGCDPR